MEVDQIKRLSDILQVQKALVSGLKVQTIGLRMEMEVMGFIPCSTTRNIPFLQFDSNYAVGADKIRIKILGGGINNIDGLVFQIARRLEVVGIEQSYLVNDSLQLPDYDRINVMQKYRSNYWSSSMGKVLSLSKAFKIEKGQLYYVAQADDFVFYRKQDKGQNPIVIAKDYYCLCAYINKITGKICYHLYSPDDLVIIPNT